MYSRIRYILKKDDIGGHRFVLSLGPYGKGLEKLRDPVGPPASDFK